MIHFYDTVDIQGGKLQFGYFMKNAFDIGLGLDT